jgi:predicted permease
LTSAIVLAKTATLFLLIAVGWLSRRRGYLSADSTSILGRFVVDVSLPALIVVQMIATVSRDSWREDGSSLALAAVVFVIALAIGLATAPLCAPRESRSTYAFLVGIPNWVYLPLPIAQELFGSAGLRSVLICNVTSQLLLWSAGVTVLRGRISRDATRKVLLNPGILAAVVGIGLALLVPEAKTWRTASMMDAPSWGPAMAKVVLDSLDLLGQLTIPLSLLLIGAQLGGMRPRRAHRGRVLGSLLVARLLIAPLATFAAFQGLEALGWDLPEVPKRVTLLISAMPVAVTCGIMTERYDGDAVLGARAIFASTLLSLLTLPLIMWAFESLAW